MLTQERIIRQLSASKLAPIGEADVSAVAVTAVRRRDEVSSAASLVSNDSVRRTHVAPISAAFGHDITADNVSRADAVTSFDRVLPEWEAEAVLLFLDDADACNCPASDTFDTVLERSGRRYSAWAVD